MQEIERCENRLKSIMVMDKQEVPTRIVRVLKAELLYVLKNYFDLTAEDLDVDLGLNESGRYVLSVSAMSDTIHNVSVIPR